MSDIEKYLMITVSQKSSEGWRLTKNNLVHPSHQEHVLSHLTLNDPKKYRSCDRVGLSFAWLVFYPPKNLSFDKKTHLSLPRDDELIAVDELPLGYFRF